MEAATGTATQATFSGLDGPVDAGLEQAERVVRAAAEHRDGEPDRGRGGGMRDLGAEAAAHAVLRMVADHPGQMGRLRAARIVGGYSVPHRDEQTEAQLERYALQLGWTLRELVDLVDALIGGGLVTQTVGPRPVLVLTRPGFHALDALERGSG